MKRYTVKNRVKKLKKRATASAVAGATALGILLGSNFKTPTELLECKDLNARPAITDMLLTAPSPDEENEDMDSAVEERKKSPGRRFKIWVAGLPYHVRAFIGIPLWCVGWLILSTAGLLWEPVLSPVLSALVNCLCVAGIIAAALIMTVKAAFPDMPINKILNRRSLGTLFIGALLFGAAGAIMQIFLPDYRRLRDIAEGAILLCVLAAAAVPVLRHEARRRRDALRIAAATAPGHRSISAAPGA